MPRTFAAAMLSATLALTTMGSAAPAHANNDDLKRILGGVAAVVILGATIDNLRDRNRRADPPVARHDPKPLRDRHHDKRYDRRHDSRIVPSQCLRSVDSRHGPRQYFARPCLRRTMSDAHRLPQACAITVQRQRGPIIGYAPRCLRDYGWRRG